MNTRSDLESELQSLLLSSGNSGLYGSTRLTELIQNAYTWAKNLHNWQALADAQKTSTEVDRYYYDYPSKFKTGSVFRIEINGLEYNRKNYEDFLDYKKNYPTSSKRIFSNYGRRYFIFPTPTERLEKKLIVWGVTMGDDLTEATSTTIFSYGAVEGNEAVVRKAYSVALRRIDPTQSREEETIARAMLGELWNQEQESVQRDQRIQHPKFNVPDFFAGGGSATPQGRFNYDPSEDY